MTKFISGHHRTLLEHGLATKESSSHHAEQVEDCCSVKRCWSLFNIAEWLRRGPWSAISTGLPRQERRWPARRWSCPSPTSISCRARTTTWARWGWPTWGRRRRERCCTSTTQPGQTSGCPPALTPSSSSFVSCSPLPFVLTQVLCRRGEGLGQLVIVSGAGGRSLLRRNWQVSLQHLSTRLSSFNKFVFWIQKKTSFLKSSYFWVWYFCPRGYLSSGGSVVGDSGCQRERAPSWYENIQVTLPHCFSKIDRYYVLVRLNIGYTQQLWFYIRMGLIQTPDQLKFSYLSIMEVTNSHWL